MLAMGDYPKPAKHIKINIEGGKSMFERSASVLGKRIKICKHRMTHN
jgi:hypothetical protein